MNRISLIVAGAALVLAACGTASAQAPATASSRAAATAAAPIDHTGHTATAATATTPATATAGAPAATSATATGAAAIAPAAAATTNPIVAPAVTLPPTAAPIAPQPTSAPATAAPAQSGTVVTVTLVDTGVRLSRTSAPAGPVTFRVTNGGTVQHELVVLQTSIAQNQIPVDPSQPALVQEPGLLGKVSALAPGASGSLTVTLGPGTYVLMCNELAHYLIGMHAAFTAN